MIRSPRSARWNRRGISPLVATVLLLAFAVAVGTMAVSYVLDFAKSDVCGKVSIALQTPNVICVSNARVSFIVSNTGDTALSNLLVRFITPAKDIDERRVALAVKPASATKVDLDYKNSVLNGTAVTLIPAIAQGTTDKFCTDKAIQATLVPCQ